MRTLGIIIDQDGYVVWFTSSVTCTGACSFVEYI